MLLQEQFQRMRKRGTANSPKYDRHNKGKKLLTGGNFASKVNNGKWMYITHTMGAQAETAEGRLMTTLAKRVL